MISAAPRRFDGRDVDLLHGHHGIERALCFATACSERFGEHARRDLPGEAPFVFTPAARTFLTAVADDGVPVIVGFLLIVGRDLERERFTVFERRPAIEAETGNS